MRRSTVFLELVIVGSDFVEGVEDREPAPLVVRRARKALERLLKAVVAIMGRFWPYALEVRTVVVLELARVEVGGLIDRLRLIASHLSEQKRGIRVSEAQRALSFQNVLDLLACFPSLDLGLARVLEDRPCVA